MTGLLAKLSHGTSDLSDTSKTDGPEPFTEAELGHAEGDDCTADSADNEDQAEDPVDLYSWYRGETNDTTEEERNPVAESEDKDGALSVLLHDFISFVYPRDSSSLEKSEQKHEVDSKIVINDIKEGETPVEAENN